MHRQSKKVFRLGSLFSPAVVVVAAFLVPAVHATTTSYTGTGSTTFTVPANVTSIQVTLTGAAGGVGGDDGSNQGGNGGPAGRVTGTLAVTPGDTLTFSRGGSGGNGTGGTSNGGGGAGGSNAGGRVASGKGGDAGASGSSGGVVEEGEVPLSPGVVSPSRRLAELVAVAGLATLLQIRRGLVEIPMRVTTV